MKKLIIILYFLFILFLPAVSETEGEMEKLKQEIMTVERQFAGMAGKRGVREAFLFYAAEDAVIMRNNKVYKGKTEIGAYFDSVKYTDIQLNWVPDFIDISSSGDLAYTFGKYTFSARDEAGKRVNSDGVFHTVWKKQADGTWKYVWD